MFVFAKLWWVGTAGIWMVKRICGVQTVYIYLFYVYVDLS
jgi:hypothetical protein